MRIGRFFAGVLIFATFLASSSCIQDPTVLFGTWTKVGDFVGVPRSGAFSFVIQDNAYVGGGYGRQGTSSSYLTDFYRHDGNTWYHLEQFPGTPREGAVAFSIGDKGYVGLGYNRDSTKDDGFLKDFWEYDIVKDEWRQLRDFAGIARSNAVAFGNSLYGYVGTGYHNEALGDFYQYDPSTDTWSVLPGYGGKPREQAVALQVGGLVYILSGMNRRSGENMLDLWRFDLSLSGAAAWVDVTPVPGDSQYDNLKNAAGRYGAVAFTVDGFGYIVTGVSTESGQLETSMFGLDPIGNTWMHMAAFPVNGRTQGVGYSINKRGFAGTGTNADPANMMQFDDMERFVF